MYVGMLPALWPILIDKHHLSLTLVGAFTTGSSLLLIPAQPLTGHLVDRYGLLNVTVVVGLLLASILMPAAVYPASFVAVAVMVIAARIGNSLLHPGSARQVTAAQDRAGAAQDRAGAAPDPAGVAEHRTGLVMSIFVFGGNVGQALGPIIILAIITRVGTDSAMVASLPGVIMAAILWAYLRRPLRPGIQSGTPKAAAGTHPKVQIPKAVWLLVLIMSTRAGIWGTVSTFLPVHLVRQGVSVFDSGVALTIYNLGGAAIGLFAGGLADRYGRRRVFVASLVLAAISLGLFLMGRGPISLLWLTLAGAGILSPSPIGVVLAQEHMPENKATASGMMMGMSYAIGTILVTPIGKISDAVGTGVGLWVLVGLTFVSAALALLLPQDRH
jgi:FSR family fosmidomycin resistance protein-like MFS transporter